MKVRSVFSAAVLVLGWIAAPAFAIDGEGRPVGWDDMSGEEQGAFLDLQSGFLDRWSELSLSQEEYAQLSKAEKSEINQELKGLEVEYRIALDDAGYALQNQVAAKVKKEAKPAGSSILKGAAGTVIYDTGIPFGGGDNSGDSNMVGNRFDTALGEPLTAAGTISKVTYYAAGVSPPNVFFSLYTNISGTMADRVTSHLMATNNGTGTFNSFTFATPHNYSNGTFLAGIWRFDPDRVGVDAGTNAGQGFHGVFLNDGNPGTGLADLETTMGAGLNAMVRLTGGNLIPVELMKIEVETKDSAEKLSKPQP